MELLITILSGLSILFGLVLFFSPARGAMVAGIVALGAGVYAYDSSSLTPLVVGFVLLWILRLLGFEKR